MNHIDTIDERILAELQENGRLTMKALAERVGLSSPAMIERVRRLEDRGVIAGYRAIVAPEALGRPLTALVAAEVEHQHFDAFLKRVKDDSAVTECHRTTGEATFLVKVSVPDTAALETFVDELGAAGARCQTSLVLSSPVSWREVTPPPGSINQRTRVTRRRRRNAAPTDQVGDANGTPPRRRPGRPRGRRTGAA